MAWTRVKVEYRILIKTYLWSCLAVPGDRKASLLIALLSKNVTGRRKPVKVPCGHIKMIWQPVARKFYYYCLFLVLAFIDVFWSDQLDSAAFGMGWTSCWGLFRARSAEFRKRRIFWICSADYELLFWSGIPNLSGLNFKSEVAKLSQASQMSSPDIIIAFKLAIKRVSHSSIIFALAVLVFLRGRLRLIAGQSLDLIISKAENRLRASFNMHVFRNIPFCRILRGYMRIAKA